MFGKIKSLLGENHLCSDKELRELRKKLSEPIGSNKISKEGNIFLSKHLALSRNCAHTFLNCNVLVVGTPGTGKTYYYTKPNLEGDSSFVIIDPAGEIYKSTADVLREKGYDVKVLDLKDGDGCKFNPLSYVRTLEDVPNFVECLVPDGSKGDEFFLKAERMLFIAVISYLLDRPEEERTLANVYDLVNKANRFEDKASESEFSKLFAEYAEKYPDSAPVHAYNVFLANGGKTAKSILISAMVRLNDFKDGKFAKLTSGDDLDLDNIGRTKQIYYIISDTFATSEHNSLITLFLTSAIRRIYANGEKRDIHFILDEFCQAVPKIPNFEMILATSRKYGLCWSLIVQSITQIKSVYGDDAYTIMGNCSTKLFLGSTLSDDVEYISKLVGEKKDSNGHSQVILTPSDIRMMRPTTCIVVINGKDPVIDEKCHSEEFNYLTAIQREKAAKADAARNDDEEDDENIFTDDDFDFEDDDDFDDDDSCRCDGTCCKIGAIILGAAVIAGIGIFVARKLRKKK